MMFVLPPQSPKRAPDHALPDTVMSLKSISSCNDTAAAVMVDGTPSVMVLFPPRRLCLHEPNIVGGSKVSVPLTVKFSVRGIVKIPSDALLEMVKLLHVMLPLKLKVMLPVPVGLRFTL